MDSRNEAPLYSEEESLEIRYENYQKTQNFNIFHQAMMENARRNHIPYKGTFELTPRCSLKCKMCYMRLDAPQMKEQGRELTADEWIRLGEMAFEAGTFDLLITGGEPMLRPDFPKIYTALTDMGFLTRLYTNATLITPEIMDLLRERPPQSMEITLYGASEETYEKVTGWGEGYTRATRAIDELRTFAPSILLKTTLIRDNAPDYQKMQDWAHQRALKMEYTSQPFLPVRGACCEAATCRMTVDELIEFHRKHNLEIGQDGCSQPDPADRRGIFCPAGETAYVIEWTGAMVACNADDDPNRPVGYPLQEGFDSAWNKLRAFRDKPLPEPCKTCEAYAQCSCCAVHHRIESGSFDKQGKYVCDFARRMCGLETID